MVVPGHYEGDPYDPITHGHKDEHGDVMAHAHPNADRYHEYSDNGPAYTPEPEPILHAHRD